MNARSTSGCVITAVCDVAGMIASREAGSGLPMSPITSPPSSLKHAHVVLQRRDIRIARGDEDGPCFVPSVVLRALLHAFWKVA